MKQLSKKARRLSLTIFFILFIIIGPLVLGYSLGYRFDGLSNPFTWIKTGGIYIHSDLSNVDVYKDGEFVKTTGFFIRNIFIQNLREESGYFFELHKDGYHSWIKTLPIREGFVNEAHALMLPKEIDKTAFYPFITLDGVGTTTNTTENNGELIDFLINDDFLKLEVLFGLTTSTAEDDIDIIQIKDGQNLENEINLDESATAVPVVVKIPEYFTLLGIENPDELENLITNNNQIAWLENGNVVIYWIGREDRIPFYFCDFDECNEKILVDWQTEIKRFDFLPNRNDVIIVLNEEGIWATELDNRSARNVQPIYLGQSLDFRINSNNRIVVLDEGIFYELRF